MNDTLDLLVQMTRALGEPERDYVIIGEGNTSYRSDDETFWIKASGQQMHNIDRSGFVGVRLAPILDLLDATELSEADLKAGTKAATLDPSLPVVPSIEVTFHAALLADCGARCIAHTHPIAINRLMCSSRAEQFARERMFPDQIVLCGPCSPLVPYTDPGLPLALAIRAHVRAYMDEYGEAPKVVLLANHGLIALGQTPTEALNITAMCVKAAEIFAGACAVGEPVFLSSSDVMHIYKRPDEIYRRNRFVGN
jgi:rhamnose utilization protein RhaD (predicted bifunctional aldolase and dehydrogenase)